MMKLFRFWSAAALIAAATVALAKDGQVLFSPAEGIATIAIDGDKDDDWRLQASGDLTNWVTITNFGTLLSSGTNPPMRMITLPTNAFAFLRAQKTEGLYDPTLFRAISLTFTQSNWQTLLANARTSGGNVPCTVVTDNGSTNITVGARYKGNTSYSMGGTKKSINLDFNYAVTNADLMHYTTVNLNNAAGDETIMREPVYFTVMHRYAVSPVASMCRLFINGADWGVYSLTQQENDQLVREFFPSDDGDRWRAPNAAAGGFTSGASALTWLNTTNVASYRANYELKKAGSGDTNLAWTRLVASINALINTPAANYRSEIENTFAVDRWLWFLAVENIFADDDSYFNKGADYGFYFEPETGRMHPLEHDGNEAFTAGDAQLTPVQGDSLATRPLLQKFLGVPELRQRYLAHMRTILSESFNPTALYPLITQFHTLSISAIIADPKKSYTMATYTNDLTALKSFVSTRYAFLTNHAELRPLQPFIDSVNGPTQRPAPTEAPFITAQVRGNGTEGVSSVWLYYRDKSYGKCTVTQMFDDGAHSDGVEGDGIYGATTAPFPAGNKIHYYVEARSSNTAKAARFSPPRAEEDPYSYRVALATAPNTPVVINEIMASNTATLADPQGEFDDWIELHNITEQEVDLTGRYLSDEPNNPRKWAFPLNTKIPANSYLLVWADEDGAATSGLHASFKLSADGETVYLADTDANFNAVLDNVTFGSQNTDQSYSRTAADSDVWLIGVPTPNAPNK